MATDKKDEITNEIIKRQNDNIRRIRVTEEALRNNDVRINSIEQRYLQETKKIYDKLKELEKRLKDIEIQQKTTEVQQDMFKKSTKKFATQNDLNQIKNYIELINQMLSKYITNKELQYYLSVQKK